MENAENHSAEQDTRLEQILAAYLKALEQEPALGVEDFIKRNQDHAGYEAELGGLLDNIQWLGFVKPSSPDCVALEKGEKLGPYEIVEFLGDGSQGRVYRAHDSKLKRDVAIKVLPEEFSRDADRAARFQLEAEFLAKLNHPNIASIFGIEEFVGKRFLVLELIEVGVDWQAAVFHDEPPTGVPGIRRRRARSSTRRLLILNIAAIYLPMW